ncbi:hypothetical protein P3342_009562 [Pyrenophora teres f. teres]|nr:hypothetical protein P3342_009562 [Pyrenophora teres f. teres]
MAEKTELQRRLPTRHSRYQRITEANAKNSPLLRLAAELRTMIYEYALDNTIVLVRYPYEVPLILTCRQIQHEAQPLTFAHGTFYYFDIINLLNPRMALGQDKRNMITSISVTFGIAHYMAESYHLPHVSHEYHVHRAEKEYRHLYPIHFPNLKRIHIRGTATRKFSGELAKMLGRNCGCKDPVITFDTFERDRDKYGDLQG